MIFTAGQTYSISLHNIMWGFFAGAYVTTNNLIWATYYGRRSLGAIQGIVLPASVGANALAVLSYGFLLDSGLNAKIVWIMSMALFVGAGTLLFMVRPPKLRVSPVAPAAMALSDPQTPSAHEPLTL
jgi:hypothetical protein